MGKIYCKRQGRNFPGGSVVKNLPANAGHKDLISGWIQKTKITASGPITLWEIDGETMDTVTDFIFLGSKIIADGDYSCEIKMLAPWKKSYDQPRQHIKKQRHYFAD